LTGKNGKKLTKEEGRSLTESDRLLRELLSRHGDGGSKSFDEYIRLKDEIEKILRGEITLEEVDLRGGTDADAGGGDPRVIADYRIISKIGSGGMGTVYEAEQRSLGRPVAIKILPSHLSLSDDAIRKFRREAEAGGRQSHPGIVAIHQVGEHGGVHYIVQELVGKGRTMADRIEELRKSRNQPPGYFREAAVVIAKVADALEHAHGRGVVHRDVKPSNILLTGDGDPKVSDFGLAKVEDALALSRTGDCAGTVYYMSPEQTTGRRIGIDHRTDIYSLGVTFFEMLTLRRPFDGETTPEVMNKIHFYDPRDPSRINARVPRDLAVICLKAMEKNPSHRYRTMREFSEDIGRFLSGDAIHAKPSGPAARLGKRIKRNPGMSTAICVIFTLAAILVLVLAFGERGFDVEKALLSIGSRIDQAGGNRVVLQRLDGELSELEFSITGPLLVEYDILKDRLDRKIRYTRPETGVALRFLDMIESERDDFGLIQVEEALSELSGCKNDLPDEERGRAVHMEKWLDERKLSLRAEQWLRLSVDEVDGGDQLKRARSDLLDSLPFHRDDDSFEAVERKLEEIAARGEDLVDVAAERKRLAREGFTYCCEETFSCGGVSRAVRIYRHDKTGLEFVRIPAGLISMGSPDAERERSVCEGPVHPVFLESFLLCRTECTRAAWESVAGEKGGYFEGARLPVEEVTWEECAAWCEKAGLRLPTEAEWEHACRAGTAGPFSFGEEVSSLESHAWFNDNAEKATHPVRELAPNAFGLYDMHGNVWEWCSDSWHKTYENAPRDGSSWEERGAAGRVIRGGGYNNSSRYCRCAHRSRQNHSVHYNYIGFRPAF